MTKKIEMEGKPVAKFEDLADIFMYKEDAHGIWRIPNTSLQLDHQHVWSLRRMIHFDGSWILLKDGRIVAMAKREQHILASGSSKWHQHRRRSCRKLF